MRKLDWFAIGAIAAGLVLTPALHAEAQSSTQPAKTAEIGVTSSEIRIGVVADVDSPLSPGLFQGVVDGVRGAVRYLNSKAGGGGIAGRKLVVDFLDSKLNPTASRDAVITACGQDYALVGTAAFFLTNFDDAVNCKDQTGASTGIPDFAAVVSPTEGCTPISFPVNPPNVMCDTLAKAPQTYQVNQGTFTYLVKKHKQPVHGAMIYSNNTKAGSISSHVLIEGAEHAGIKADNTPGVSSTDPQSAFTPIVQQMKQDNSNFAYSVSTSSSAIELKGEAQLQGLTSPDIVWACTTGCYDKTVAANAQVMDNTYVSLSFLPFEEAGTNKMLANFVKYVGAKTVSGFAVYGWTSALAFAQAAKAAVAKSGGDGLTRSALLKGAMTLTAFDAGGMIGKTDVAHKVQTACVATIQLRNGNWIRLSPVEKGTFDCTPSNHVEFKADLANQ